MSGLLEVVTGDGCLVGEGYVAYLSVRAVESVGKPVGPDHRGKYLIVYVSLTGHRYYSVHETSEGREAEYERALGLWRDALR